MKGLFKKWPFGAARLSQQVNSMRASPWNLFFEVDGFLSKFAYFHLGVHLDFTQVGLVLPSSWSSLC